jgi:hypothetical protein
VSNHEELYELFTQVQSERAVALVGLLATLAYENRYDKCSDKKSKNCRVEGSRTSNYNQCHIC